MQTDALLSFILAGQSVHNIEDYFIPELAQSVKLRHRFCQTLRVHFEPEGVIHAAHGQTIKVSRHTGPVVV